MRVLLASPFLPPFYEGLLTERKTVTEIMSISGDTDWCEDYIAVRLNGCTIPKVWWPHVTVKPEAQGCLELCVVPQKKSIIPILATVALVAITAAIVTFGLPFAGIAAGSFAATLIASGVGIAGQIAITALTAPPAATPSAKGAGATRDLSQAGISANQVTLLETLSVVFGKMLVSPPVLAPPYTTLDNEELTIHAIVGLQGRCLIENILVNGTDIALLESIEYETREGGPADTALTLARLTCVQQTDQMTLSNFRTKLESASNDQLIDQVTPDNSAPDWHYFTTDGEADEIWLRFLFPSGIVKASVAQQAVVPVRVEIRKVGDVDWRAMPTMHVFDIKKGGGPLRVEVKLIFGAHASGPYFSNAKQEYPIFELTNITGIGQAFEYQADAYFQDTSPDYTGILPVMSGATTSGVTFSASSEFGASNAAWKAADNNETGTSWRPAANSLPAWLKIQLAAPATIRSYEIFSETEPTAATEWYVRGSNDGVAWTLLDPDPVITAGQLIVQGQIGVPGSYLYYEFNFTANNGAASEDLRVADIALFTRDAYGIYLSADGIIIPAGFTAQHSSGSDPRSLHGSLNKNGANFYLDPAEWLPGAYEVRVKRGVAFDESDFQPLDYSWGGNTANSDFFEYRLSSGKYITRLGQKDYRSDMVMEVFSTVSNDIPVDTTGIACIAIELRNTVINSIAAEFTSYAPVYSAGVWTDAPVPTANPAALYRQLKLGHANPNPQPGEILNEDELAAWYERCAAAGHEVNFVQQGRSLAEVFGVIAYCGYASPRESNMISVVEDYDRSGEAISQMLSPLNSKLLGTNVPLPELEHAIYAEYFDEDDDYNIARPIFYREGYDANTATLFGTITYDGFTDAVKVAERAAFDLKQVVARARTVRLEVGIEGYSLHRGKLVGHNDDTLDVKQAQALIVSIQTSGGDITGITVDNVIPFAANQDELAAFVEGLSLAAATGVAIRLDDGTSIVKTLSNVADSNVCTFTTPFTEAGSGVAVGQMAVFGQAGRDHRRMLVMAVEPQGLETRIVTLANEAPELFA